MADSDDDDKTVFDSAAPTPAEQVEGDNTLPVGTRLGEFELIGLVGVGGFGIVYLAQDHSLGRRVALKEYMPSSLASRSQGSQRVGIKSERHAETFEAGRRSFVNEARLLAQFDHPALVKVYRFWEANGTAYMVMPYYEGATLKRVLQQMGAPPDEVWLRRLLAPLLEALETIHAAHVFHRDIAPDNILLLAGERPLLLDFGAARHAISDMTQALTVILKPGYAPVEQYAELPELRQGAWTDIYALCAVVHFAIMGKTPPPAVGRTMNDTMQPLALQAAGRYSNEFLRAIDLGLSVKPVDRPQSVAEFRELIASGTAALMTPHASTAAPRPNSEARSTSLNTAKSKAPLLVGGFVMLAALAVGGYFLAEQDLLTPPAGTQEPVVTLPPAPEPAPLPQPPSPVLNPVPFTARAELDRIFQERNREHTVTVALDRAQVRIGRDRLSFRVRSSRPGYLYILMVGTDNAHFYKLFPNAFDARNRIDAGEELTLPRTGWVMIADGPPGANQFVAIVSEHPRDFASVGLVDVGPFAEFPPDMAAELAARHTGPQSPFLGEPACPDLAGECADPYGAATFTIEEIESPVAEGR